MSISGLITPDPEPATTADIIPVGKTPSNAPVDAILNQLMSKITDLPSQKKFLKILIYGPPDSGKTVVMGSAPNNLIIDVEDGLISLQNHPDLVKPTVATYPYKSFEALEIIIQKFAEEPEELAKYETLSIDTMSDLHKRGLEETIEREYRLRGPSVVNRFVPTTDHQQENNERIRRLMSSLRDLNRNIIITAHSRTIEPKNKPANTFPDFSESLSNKLAGIVDVVAYMEKKEIEGNDVRTLRFHSTPGIMSKCRIGGFPDVMLEPTWDKIYAIYSKNKENEK